MSLVSQISGGLTALATAIKDRVSGMPAVFSAQGTLTTRTGSVRFPVVGGTYTIDSVRATVGTAPTGASLIVDVNKNGTTIYGTQSNRPTIAASSTAANGGTASVTTVTTGDYLTVDIDQIGSTVAGADLTVIILLKRTGS